MVAVVAPAPSDRDSVPVEELVANLQEQIGRKFEWIKTALPFMDYARNILAQTRQVFPNTAGLANSMASDGMYYEPMVVRLDLAGVERYLKELRYAIPRARHRVADIFRADDGYYYILIAGERRTRGHWYQYEEGCERCKQSLGGSVPKGVCLEVHFPSLMMPVILFTDLSADEAVEIQLKENTHEAVREQDEAVSYFGLWRLRTKRDPRYTLKQFCLDVGRPYTQVRRMLLYGELPRIITDDVEKGLLGYGHAVELARLIHEGIYETKGLARARRSAKRLQRKRAAWRPTSEAPERPQTNHYTLEDWIIDAIVGDMSVRKLRRRVTGAINDFRLQQRELTDLFSQAQDAVMRRNARRQSVFGITRRNLGENVAKIEQILTLYEEGRLGLEDSPYGEQGIVEFLVRDAKAHARLRDHVRRLMTLREAERYAAIAEDGERFVKELKAAGLLPTEDKPPALIAVD